jgi:uncharacterized Zn-binding protein involved in type VI secretion
MAAKGVGRVNVDTAGGVVDSTPNSRTIVGGHAVVVVGAHVASHGTGAHANATFASGGTGRWQAGGLNVIRQGDAATCGDTLTPGSSRTFSG